MNILVIPDPWGGDRGAFLASTAIDRQDFGGRFNQRVEGVGMIGNQVEILIAIEGVRQWLIAKGISILACACTSALVSALRASL